MRRLAVVTAGLTLLLFLGVPSASAKDVPLPPYAVGDEWRYAIAIHQAGALVQTGDRHVVVTQRGTFDFHGSPREAVTLTTYENLSGDPSYSYEDILDASTGALLATRSGGETLLAAEPCVRVDWPVAFPKSWTETCDLGFGPSETTHIVAGGETLTVPAGTYETLSVDSVGESSLRKWFAAEACGVVAELHLRNDVASYINLTSVRCTPILPTPSATPGPTPTGATPAGATPTSTTTTPTRATATPTTPTAPPTAAGGYDYSCPAGTTQAQCLDSDADGDGVNLSREIELGTDPRSNDTDGDGVRDNGDDYPTDASQYRGSPPLALVGALGLAGAALLARRLRRKDS